MDMVQEIKVQTSNFGADSAKGPVVINAVGKSGGAQFHGTAYLFARNGVLNANDWYSNYQSSARPPTSYLYPGGNIGGPILIPGTNFNHNKKLRFFAGGEVYKQTLFYGLLQSFIPTPRMLSGDLTPASIAAALNVSTTDLAKTCPNFYTTNGGGANAPTLAGSGGICSAPGAGGTAYTQQDQIISQGVVVGGTGLLPVDPRALIYAKFWPAPNRTPQAVPAQNLLSDGFNYVNALTNSANGYQLQGRIDEDFTDSLKLNVTYKYEKSNFQEPVKNEFYAGSDVIPYPTSENSQTKSNGVNLNLTKTVGASLTNEFLVSGVLYNQPANFANSSIVQDSSTGWAGGRFYNNGAHQLPGIVDYENGVPDFAMAYDPPSGGKFLHKFSYNVGDNVTRQIRSHTVKVGVYFETSGNNQLPYSFTQGENTFNHYQAGCVTNQDPNTHLSSGHISQLQNNVANFLQGCSGFSQASSSTAANLRYRTADVYVNDSWKTTRKLTLTLGIRFDHLGAWYDPGGTGLAVWNAPAKHVSVALPGPPAQNYRQYPGISSHQTNPSIPISGQSTRPLFYSPRIGLAYDVYGTGKTTLRGGWGVYRFHDSYNDSAGALGTTLGIQNYTTPANLSCTYDQITQASMGNMMLGASCLPAAGAVQLLSPFTIYALDANDDKQPVTYDYNMTVDQVMPWGGNLELSYVGNQSHDTFTAGNLSNQNYIPLGGLFQPDPLTGAVTLPGSGQQVIADYRPYPNYSSVFVPNHIGYGNYNGLQISYEKQKGAFIYRVNYTWSKALGIRGDYRTGTVGDPSNLRNNYGYLGFNRNNIVNATYSWQVGNLYKGNRFVAHVVNQWEFSGITGLQSGPDIAVLTGGGNFALGANVTYTPPGANTSVVVPTGNTSFLGTPDITLQPIVTCDPRKNLHNDPKLGHQYINGSCFALPQYGSNGNFELPDVHGPAYFDSDLTVKRSCPPPREAEPTVQPCRIQLSQSPSVCVYGRSRHWPESWIYWHRYVAPGGVCSCHADRMPTSATRPTSRDTGLSSLERATTSRKTQTPRLTTKDEFGQHYPVNTGARFQEATAVHNSSFRGFVPGTMRQKNSVSSVVCARRRQSLAGGLTAAAVLLAAAAAPLAAQVPAVVATNTITLATGFSAGPAVTDACGNVYVYEGGGTGVVQINAVTGIVTVVAKNTQGYTSSGQALYMDPAKQNLYYPDFSNFYTTHFIQQPINNCAPGTPNATFGGNLGNLGNYYWGTVMDVAGDAAGNVYFTTTANVQKAIYKETLVAGTNTYTDTQIITWKNNMSHIAADAAGDVFFVDQSTSDVYELPITGTTYASTPIILVPASHFGSISGLSLDPLGNLYITDVTNNLIFEVPLEKGALNPTDLYATASIGVPFKVAVDASHIIYLSNYGPGAAKLTAGSALFPATAVGSTSANSTLTYVFNSAVTPTAIKTYAGTAATTRFTPSGGTCVMGTAQPALSTCTVTATFSPSAVGLRTGALVFSYATGSLTSNLAGVSNGAAATIDPGTVVPSTTALTSPFGITVDNVGNVFVTDTSANTLTEFAAGFGGAGTAISTGTFKLSGPKAVAVDASGDIFIADTGNNRILEIPVIAGVLTPASTFALPLTPKSPQGVAVGPCRQPLCLGYGK